MSEGRGDPRWSGWPGWSDGAVTSRPTWPPQLGLLVISLKLYKIRREEVHWRGGVSISVYACVSRAETPGRLPEAPELAGGMQPHPAGRFGQLDSRRGPQRSRHSVALEEDLAQVKRPGSRQKVSGSAPSSAARVPFTPRLTPMGRTEGRAPAGRPQGGLLHPPKQQEMQAWRRLLHQRPWAAYTTDVFLPHLGIPFPWVDLWGPGSLFF